MNCKTLLDNYVDDDTYVHLEMLKYSGNEDEPEVVAEIPTIKLSEMAYADFRAFMKKEILEIVPVMETIENELTPVPVLNIQADGSDET